MRKLIILLGFLFVTLSALPQFVPEHISNKSIYLFLDELASAKLISVNTAIKPWSKSFIAQKLVEASAHRDSLSKRQIKELDFYLKSYRPDLPAPTTLQWQEKLNIFKKQPHLATSLNPFALVYKDSLFTFSIRPVYGISIYNNENGHVTHTWGGIEAYGTIAGHLGIYASLRDNHETQLFALPTYLTQEMGGNYKINEGGRTGGDYSEMRGGITYAWKWGDIGLVKDHFEWGTNYHGSNIFSGRTPSFAQIRLHLHPAKWIELNYVHGWLVSEVIDTAQSYYNNGQYRAVYRQKFLAANMITIIPVKHLNFSIGNSIIYSDMGGVHPAYLIPLAFYKSIDHTLTHNIDNENSQMFIDISSYNIRHLHLYASVYVDDFSVTRINNSERHNFISRKAGFSLSNWPVKNLIYRMEYTFSNPMVYKHRVPAVTFESNKFNLGHYLSDNSKELYMELTSKPFRGTTFTASYNIAVHGNEYAYLDGNVAELYPVLQDKSWQSHSFQIDASYEFINNGRVFISYENQDIQGFDVDGKTSQYYLDLFSPPFYQGKTNTISFGFNIGF